MGSREKLDGPERLWVAATELPRTVAHPFYGQLSVTPGPYFRSLLVGYFEGIESERGIASRVGDSLAVGIFWGCGWTETAPEHSAISRTRRRIDLESHQGVFTWVQVRLVETGLLKAVTVDVNATTLQGHRTMGQRGELPGVLDQAGQNEQRDRDADAGKTWRGWTPSTRAATRTG